MNRLYENQIVKKITYYGFYLAYFIELGMLLVDKSELINPYEGRLFRLTFLFCAICIALKKYTKKEWLLFFLFCVITAISYIQTERNDLIRIVFFVFAAKNIDIKRLLKITFYITFIGVVTLMLLSAFHILGWNYVESDFDGNGPQGIIRRYCFGLGHPNAFHCMLWAMILLYFYLWLDRLKWYHFCVVGMINIGFGYFTKSKTGILITFGTILLAILFRYVKESRNKSYIYMLGGISILFCTGFSIYIANYGAVKPLLVKLDGMLTGRLWISEYLGGTQFWSLFSNPTNQEYFDMGYTRLFYWYGIIPAVLYLIVVLWFLWYCYKKGDYKAALVVIMFSLYTTVEAHGVSIYIARNYIILLLFGIWNMRLEYKEEENGSNNKEKSINRIISNISS
ncbi:MAG: hypothetical protein ACRC7V_01740 [Lachnospiraceae bacterium]